MGIAAGAMAACTKESSAPAPPEDAGSEATTDDGSTADAADASDAADGRCSLSSSYGSKQCNECISTRCCAVVEACEAVAACKVLSDCMHGCMIVPDAGGCATDCKQKYPDDGTWKNVQDCWLRPPPNCGVECN